MDIYNEYKDMFDYSEILVKRFYRVYKKSYEMKGWAKEDLLQEIKMIIFKLVNSFLKKQSQKVVISSSNSYLNELKKEFQRNKLSNICRKFTVLTLLRIKEKRWSDALKHASESVDINYNTVLDEVDGFEESQDKLPFTLENNIFASVQPEVPPFMFEDLKAKLNPTEYTILYKYYKENCTLEEIASIVHMTKQGVLFYRKKAEKKLKKYFTF